jgi:hypothetical protein
MKIKLIKRISLFVVRENMNVLFSFLSLSQILSVLCVLVSRKMKRSDFGVRQRKIFYIVMIGIFLHVVDYRYICSVTSRYRRCEKGREVANYSPSDTLHLPKDLRVENHVALCILFLGRSSACIGMSGV